MKRIKFTETRTVEAVDGETFLAGQVYDLPDPSADRWIKRGVAVLVEDEPEAAALETPRTAVKKRTTRRKRAL